MRHDDLPERWKQRLLAYFETHGEPGQTQLEPRDFSLSNVAKLVFDDGSRARFRYPLVIEAPELREIGVFTEHCGYHLFPLGGTHVVVEPDDDDD